MRFVLHGALFALKLIGVVADIVSDQLQRPIGISNDQDVVFDPSFDAFVEDLLAEWHVPGLSIAVVDNGKITSKGYGFAQLPDLRATSDTQYFTGSTTKAFTAAAAALLVHDDKYPEVSWTSPISEFIREDFILEDAHATTHTTIEDALSHRSGLPRHDLMYGQPGDTPSAVVQRIRHLPMTAEPRTKWQYCNIMYGVITDLIETVTGQKLETILQENFWKPLGMSSTSFDISSSKNLARGYYWDPDYTDGHTAFKKTRYVPDPYVDISPISGAGATISTVNDYALWIRALLNAADHETPPNASSPITRRIYRDVVTPRSIVTDALEDEDYGLIMPPLYGLGWLTVEAFNEQIVTHNGGLTGFGTELVMIPGKNYGVVTMGNTAGTSNEAGALATWWLLQKLFNDSETQTYGSFEVESGLRKIRSANSLATRSKQISLKSRKPTSQEDITPLPHSINSFAGLYSHPAYGTINLTAITSELHSPASKHTLEGLLSPRTWSVKLTLTHKSGAAFYVTASSPHGLGDIGNGEDIVWEETDFVDAVFEFGIDGQAVELLGIELDGEMIDMAEEKGEEHWREGMIWFEKVSG